MTNALDPTLPVGGSQVEVSSELRGIKSRLVADKAAVEALQVVVVPLTTMGSVGAALLASNTVSSALDELGGTATGKQVFGIADIPALQALLGITTTPEQIDIASGNQKGTITWFGGFKLNFTIDAIGGGGGSVIWHVPFTTVALAGWVAMIGGNNPGWLTGLPSLGGASVDHGNLSTHTMITFAIGV